MKRIIYLSCICMALCLCLVGCKKNNDKYTLVDRKNESHIVQCNCDYCYNTIYNSKKFIAFDMLQDLASIGIGEFRLDFTVEDFKETKDILNGFKESFCHNKPYRFTEDFTKGHLKRGVE